jgi:hypothetical protein
VATVRTAPVLLVPCSYELRSTCNADVPSIARSAFTSEKILKGEKPADLPVQQPDRTVSTALDDQGFERGARVGSACRNGEGGATRPDITTTTGVFRGTDGSNPASSSEESRANLTRLLAVLAAGLLLTITTPPFVAAGAGHRACQRVGPSRGSLANRRCSASAALNRLAHRREETGHSPAIALHDRRKLGALGERHTHPVDVNVADLVAPVAYREPPINFNRRSLRTRDAAPIR